MKEFGSFDNSCAWAVGFTPTGSEPGMCLPPATSTPEATATLEPGAIYGLIWVDFDLDQVKDGFESPKPASPSTLARVAVRPVVMPARRPATFLTAKITAFQTCRPGRIVSVCHGRRG